VRVSGQAKAEFLYPVRDNEVAVEGFFAQHHLQTELSWRVLDKFPYCYLRLFGGTGRHLEISGSRS